MMNYLNDWLHADGPFLGVHFFTLLTIALLVRLVLARRRGEGNAWGIIIIVLLAMIALIQVWTCFHYGTEGVPFMNWAAWAGVLVVYGVLAWKADNIFCKPTNDVLVGFYVPLLIVALPCMWLYDLGKENESETHRLDLAYDRQPQEEKNKLFDGEQLKYFVDTDWPEWDVVSSRREPLEIRFRTPLPQSIIKRLEKRSEREHFWHKDPWLSEGDSIVTYYYHQVGDTLHQDRALRLNLKQNTARANSEWCPLVDYGG